VTFVVFGALGCLWALASPLFSVPDEPAHVIRAVAAVRGQVFPDGTLHTADGRDLPRVEVPEIFAQAHAVPLCYVFQPDVPAGCAMAFEGSDRTVETVTTAGEYPPAYYLVVGLPSLVLRSASGVYLMRALDAAICAALLASTVVTALATPRPKLLVAGIALAVAPMVLFLAGSVNPNGVEVAAAICLWTSLGVLLSGLAPASLHHRLLLRAGVSGTVLALVRPSSPVWIALIALTLAGWAGYRGSVELLHDRRTWLVATAVGIAALSTQAWVQYYGTLDTSTTTGVEDSLAGNIRESLGLTTGNIAEMIGVFGWLDSGTATLSVFVWLFGIGAVVLLAVALSAPRRIVVLVLLAAAIVVVPVLLEAPRAASDGFIWQGRYTLPLAVGLPILAALQVDESRIVPERLVRNLGLSILVLFATGQLYAHVWATRRYTAGVDGPVNWLAADGWRPPVPVWLLFAGFVVALAGATAWLHFAADTQVPGPGQRPEPTATSAKAPGKRFRLPSFRPRPAPAPPTA
jgi:hypothetical protein